eukprot:1985935-Prymnesium_polylepis.1
MDMLCEFRTAFWNELLDVLVKEPALIAKRYLRAGFFAIDLIGTIPFQIILVSTVMNDDRWAHGLKFISLLRIAKLFRLATKDPYITRARAKLGPAGQQLVLLIGGLMCSPAWLLVLAHRSQGAGILLVQGACARAGQQRLAPAGHAHQRHDRCKSDERDRPEHHRRGPPRLVC